MPEPAPRPRWTFSAVALVVVGLVILIPSGLCTTVAGLSAVASLFASGGQILGGLFVPAMGLAISLAFVALGVGLIRTGIRERNKSPVD